MNKRLRRALLWQVASGLPSRIVRVGVLTLLFLAVGTGIFVLRHAAAQAREVSEIASDIDSGAQQLNALEWEALANGAVSPEAQIRLIGLGKEMLGKASRLRSLAAPSASLRELEGQIGAYSAAMTEELTALMAGRRAAADAIDARLTDPAFTALSANLREIRVGARQRADRQALLADLWSLLLLSFTAVLAVGLYALSRRAQQRAALQAAHARAVAESEERFRSLVQNASDTILIVSADGRIRTATGALARTLSRTADDLEGSALVDVVHGDDATTVAGLLSALAAERRPSFAAEWRMIGSDGVCRTLDVSGANLLDDDVVDGLVLTLRDVSERKRFEEQLRHRAFHDPLTQLANRALFYDRIEHALSRQGREGQLVAVLFVDLDDLKAINDGYGHAVGDEIIVGVAGRLRGCLRSSDTAARLGGDEFGILLEGVGGTGEPVQAAERILAAMREPLVVQGVPYAVSTSIGIALSSADEGADDLLRAADLAMYGAKTGGKQRYELFDRDLEASILSAAVSDGRQDEPDRITWFVRSEEQRAEIQSVLARPDDLQIATQPIIDLRTGLVAGYEALSRFLGGARRPPNAWFAQAHRCGLGPPLEALAVRRALDLEGRPPGTFLSINVSPSALTSHDIADVLPPRLEGLVLEVTENEIVAGSEDFLAAIRELRGRGALLAVDDAGSGYAGLRQLTRLNPDVIKLDRSLVSGVHADPTKGALIESFVRFAASIGAHVCAEGVETVDDVLALAEMDVTHAQGHVIGRPGPGWEPASETAAVACARSFEDALRDGERTFALESSERRLARIGLVVSEAPDAAALAGALGMMALELHADDVQVSRLTPDGGSLLTLCAYRSATVGQVFPIAAYPETRHVVATGDLSQILSTDQAAETTELAFLESIGQAALLMVPIVLRGGTVGLLEATRGEPRPFSRLEMGRARIIATQLAALVDQWDERLGEAARAA